jgi:GTPase SAR1 family protein
MTQDPQQEIFRFTRKDMEGILDYLRNNPVFIFSFLVLLTLGLIFVNYVGQGFLINYLISEQKDPTVIVVIILAVTVSGLLSFGSSELLKQKRSELGQTISSAYGKAALLKIADEIDCSNLTLFVWGRGGSGKTTFIKNAFTWENPQNSTEKTESIETYEFREPTGALSEGRVVRVADYKGQDSTQALNDRELRAFLASNEGKPIVDEIIFIVDLFPPDFDINSISDPEVKSPENRLLNKESTTDKKHKIENIIRERVLYHEGFVNDLAMQQISAMAYTKGHLRVVRLLIGKLDQLQDLVSKEYLAPMTLEELEQYAEKFFLESMRIKHIIDDYWRAKGGAKFKVSTLSLKDTNAVRKIISDILKEHSQAVQLNEKGVVVKP